MWCGPVTVLSSKLCMYTLYVYVYVALLYMYIVLRYG